MDQSVNLGATLYIRVNPKNVMTCIDVMQTYGGTEQGMTLSKVISGALAGLCEHARQAKLVPVRELTEYDGMTARYTINSRRKPLIPASMGIAGKLLTEMTDEERTALATALAEQETKVIEADRTYEQLAATPVTKLMDADEVRAKRLEAKRARFWRLMDRLDKGTGTISAGETEWLGEICADDTWQTDEIKAKVEEMNKRGAEAK